MINSPLFSPLLSAVVHGGLMGLVAWGVAGNSPTPLSNPSTYEVVFRASAPSKPPQATKPTAYKPHPKMTSPVHCEKSIPKGTTLQTQPQQLDSQQASSTPTGVTREAVYSDGTLNSLPSYPLIARKKGHEGQVELKVEVSAEGRVTGMDIHKSSDHWELDEVAIEAIKEWHFLPALKNDTPVSSEQIISFDFKLTGITVG